MLHILRVHVLKIAYTLAPKYLYRDYFKAKVYTIWVHGLLGTGSSAVLGLGFRVFF